MFNRGTIPIHWRQIMSRTALCLSAALVASMAFAADKPKGDADGWQDIMPGIQADSLARAEVRREDVTLSSNAKRTYLHLAEIAKEGKAPDSPDSHVERTAGRWTGGFPRVPMPLAGPLGSYGAGRISGGRAPTARPSYGSGPPRAAFSRPPSTKVGVTTGGMQDIGLARKMIAEGEVPYPSVFTVEGLVGEHDIPLGAVPDERGLLYPTAAIAYATRYGHKKPEAVIQIGFGAELPGGQFERPPLNLAIVVDCSGSMKGGKIAAAKTALNKILDQLNEKDRVALICFDDTVWVPFVSAPVTSTTRGAFREAVQKEVGAWGSTDIESGLKTALEQVAAHLTIANNAKQHSRVLLLTDAQPNVSATGPDAFLSLMRGAAEHGIGVTTFGIGLDFGQDLAYRIMQVRSASYHFLEDDKKLAKVFDKEFRYLVTPVAYDVKLVVSPAPGSIVTDALGVPDFHSRESLHNPKIHLDIPTLFFSARSGGGATAVTLTVPRGYQPGKDWLAEVSLEFRTTGRYEPEGRSMQYAQNLRMMLPSEVDLDTGEPYFSHDGVRKVLALADLVGAMKAATQGVMVLQQRQAYWNPGAVARNVRFGILPKLSGSQPETRPPSPARPSRITPDQAKAGYKGLRAFFTKFSPMAGGIPGLDVEVRMAEKLEQLLESKMVTERELGSRLWYGSRGIVDAGFVAEPETYLDDPAFSRYLDVTAIGQAIEQFDVPTLIDSTIQLAQGERILQRNHASGLTADRLFLAVLEIAEITADRESLKRLGEAAKAANRADWATKVRVIVSLSSESRSGSEEESSWLGTEAPTPELTPELLMAGPAWLAAIAEVSKAVILRDARRLRAFEHELTANETMTLDQREVLKQLIEQARDTIPEESNTEDKILHKLVEKSRAPLLRPRCSFPGADRLILRQLTGMLSQTDNAVAITNVTTQKLRLQIQVYSWDDNRWTPDGFYYLNPGMWRNFELPKTLERDYTHGHHSLRLRIQVGTQDVWQHTPGYIGGGKITGSKPVYKIFDFRAKGGEVHAIDISD